MTRRRPSLPPEEAPEPAPVEPASVKHRLGHQREFVHANPEGEAALADPNDVQAIRRANLAEQQAHEDALLPPMDGSARRRHWRDYWTVMLLGNGVLGLAAWLVPNVVVLVYAGAGMVVLSLGMTWLYVFVLDAR